MPQNLTPQKPPAQNLARDPAALALAALGWILADDNRAQRFLDLTGLTPDGLRAQIAAPATHRAVLEFLAGNEADLLDAAAALDLPPAAIARAIAEAGA